MGENFGKVSTLNSTTSTLTTGTTFTGSAEGVEHFSSIVVNLHAEPSNADGTLFLEFSSDGTNWDRSLSLAITDPTNEPPHSLIPVARYFRVRYTNGTTANQTAMRLQTIYHDTLSRGLVSRLEGSLTDTTDVQTTRSVLAGKDSRGNYANVRIDDDQNLNVSISEPTEAFGAVLVSDLHPIVQRKWVQGLNSELDITIGHDGGTVTASGGEIVVGTSTTTSSVAFYQSSRIIGYEPGQAVVARFTARFTTAVSGTSQIIGLGDMEDALAFGYDGTTFGVLRRTGGQAELRTLTITGASTGGGVVDVELNGTTVSTTLSGALSIAEVAGEIAASDYSTAGGGWRVFYQGNEVVFLAIDSATRGGSYSFTDTGTTGATATGPTQTIAAAAASDTWVAQASWSGDVADGTGTLPALSHTNGNVYEIQYQWLGFGDIFFRVEDPTTGRMVTVHKIEYANANTSPSLRQPDLPLYIEADNKATSSDMVVRSSSMGGFKAGEPTRSTDVRYAIDATVSTDSTRANVIVLRVPVDNSGVTNRVRVTIDSLALGNNSSNRASICHLTLNPDLIGAPSWSAIGSGSVVETDTTTTDIVSGSGRRIGTYTVGAVSGQDIILTEPREIVLEPGDILAASMALGSGGSSADQSTGFTWSES